MHDVCDHKAGHHCLVRRTLDSDDVPGRTPLFKPAPEAPTTTPPKTAMGPSDVIGRYGLASAPAGTGQIVAIIDYPDAYAVSDLAGYRSGYNLPALPTWWDGPTGVGTPNGAALEARLSTLPQADAGTVGGCGVAARAGRASSPFAALLLALASIALFRRRSR